MNVQPILSTLIILITIVKFFLVIYYNISETIQRKNIKTTLNNLLIVVNTKCGIYLYSNNNLHFKNKIKLK